MKLLIHAANLYGLGAQNVGRAIIKAIYAGCWNLPTTIVVPFADYLDRRNLPGNVNLVCKPASRAPRSFSRLYDVMFGYRHLSEDYSHVFVLGDIPLVTNIPQWVLVHQSNLAETFDSQSALQRIYYVLMGRIFKRNARRCSGFFVQSDSMEAVLLKRFPMLKGRINVIPHTLPHQRSNEIGIIPEVIKNHRAKGRFLLLYPCAGYPHKNHSLVSNISRWASSIGKRDFTIVLTLTDEEVKKIQGLPESLNATDSVLLNLGRISYPDLLTTLEYCDGIFFPSLLESFGLPLVEAMEKGKYVVASDLPYARWMCESQGIYFDPYSEKAAVLAIEQSMDRKRKNIPPNWTGPMAKIPDNWDEVIGRYLAIMGFGRSKEA